MEIKRIKALIKILEESDLETLTYKEDTDEITLSKSPIGVSSVASTPDFSQPLQQGAQDAVLEGNVIKSPLVGLFYLNDPSSQETYVTIGKKVEVGDVLAVIESMKVMNQIKAQEAGVIEKILVANESIVEFDQPLFILGKVHE